jgi:hypothetical protein
MQSGPKGTEQDVVGQCSVCGLVTKLFELPGKTEKFCLECSADVATAILLATEIDAATMAGQSADAIVCEFAEVSRRILDRSPSAA